MNDGYDADIKKSVRKAAHGLSLTTSSCSRPQPMWDQRSQQKTDRVDFRLSIVNGQMWISVSIYIVVAHVNIIYIYKIICGHKLLALSTVNWPSSVILQHVSWKFTSLLEVLSILIRRK